MPVIYTEEEMMKIHLPLIEGPARIMGEFHLYLSRAERVIVVGCQQIVTLNRLGTETFVCLVDHV